MVNDQFKTFSINLNAQHVIGMTPFDLALCTVIRYSRVCSRVGPFSKKSFKLAANDFGGTYGYPKLRKKVESAYLNARLPIGDRSFTTMA